jgi:DNA recombination protein RmuC
VLLISPTNLIVALKLVQDLWQREYQNRNAIDIAERSGALYDKFVLFVETLNDVGAHIDKAGKSYERAMKQLTDGSGNLVTRVEKLKALGAKAKKALPSALVSEALEMEEGPEEEAAEDMSGEDLTNEGS